MNDKVVNFNKIEHYVFVGKIILVENVLRFPEKPDREAVCVRHFIAEERRKGFVQDIRFKLYRKGRFAETAGDNFPYEEGDWVHIKFTMKLRRKVTDSGYTFYENTAKVFTMNKLDGPKENKVKLEDDNPFEEVVDDTLNDEFIDEKNRKYRANDKDI